MDRVGTNAQKLLNEEIMGKFLAVGIVGAFIDNVGLIVLVELSPILVEIAAIVSKEASIISMFLINEYWTFSEHGKDGHKHVLERFLKSNLIRLIGVAVGIVVLSILHRHFNVWYVYANFFGICVGFIFNYTFESIVTWRVVK